MEWLIDEEAKRVIELITMSDEEFYEKYIKDSSEEEQQRFATEFPEFRNIIEK